MSVFEKETVQNLLSLRGPQKDLVTVNHDTSLSDTLAKMADENILCVPVIGKEGEIEGLVDLYEIMSYVAWSRSSDEPTRFEASSVHLEEDVSSLLGTRGNEVDDERKSLWNVSDDDSISKVCEYFGKGVYRLIVKSDPPSLISHTDLVRYFDEKWDILGEGKNDTVQSANLGARKVISVKRSTNAAQAFRLIRIKEVHAIAVTDDAGKLLTTLSASDLRSVTVDSLDDLNLDVEHFLRKRFEGEFRPAVCCTASDDIRSVVNQIVKEHIHRVWVIDAEGKPSGVVSISDIALHLFNSSLKEDA
eukprot:TRINITY_DN1564_c0_g1_i1.p1 TRINITY_DN1564_c0_g1~~TRINITY_DN1564_c0_g1_i1.p1  ORF type:complete len:304 (-),score=68.40 TRINITY_DN1564_c0_g1_i1:56-967(-)